MTKTINYNLNKPEPNDPLRVADFNENADKIDAALGNLNTAMGQMAVPKMAVGTYKGTGENKQQTIALGFRPKAVIAWGNKSDTLKPETPLYSAMAVDGIPFTNALTITDTGFTATSAYSEMSGYYYPSLNLSGMTYLYFAIG